MELKLNLNKMLKEQEKIMAKLDSLPIEREETKTTYGDNYKEVSKTTMINYGGEIILLRYIYGKGHKVHFNQDVKAIELCSYFEIDDKMFVRCSV